MKKIFLYITLGAVGLLMACGDGNVLTVEDPAIQRAKDIAIIEDYFLEKGYSLDEVDTTTSGVRYVIIDQGQFGIDSLTIGESDIVSYDYIGRFTSDSLFDTSIRSVAEGTDAFQENRNYAPFITVYTESGWFINTSTLVQGFKDGVTATFKQMGVEGRALIVIPSDLGYGNSNLGPVPPNTVLTFELLPVKVRKQ